MLSCRFITKILPCHHAANSAHVLWILHPSRISTPPFSQSMASASASHYLRTSTLQHILRIGSTVDDEHRNEEDELESYMRHVKACNRGKESRSEFVPFVVGKSIVGYVHPSFLKHLTGFPSVFMMVRCDPSFQDTTGRHASQDLITLNGSLTTHESRTHAVGGVLKVLNEERLIPGWRDELIPVAEAFGMPPLLSIERAAAPFFGIKAYGVHMNGYVIDPKKEKYLWIAKRSEEKPNFPGMLDHLVAGGQPEGLSCKENLIKECDEEASIPKILAKNAVAVGTVSYNDIDRDKFKRDVLFCYDLELPSDFTPRNKDGEIQSFHLFPVEQVCEILKTTRLFKPNCALVVIDFLFRHGYITPEQSGYLQLFQSLRMGECV